MYQPVSNRELLEVIIHVIFISAFIWYITPLDELINLPILEWWTQFGEHIVLYTRCIPIDVSFILLSTDTVIIITGVLGLCVVHLGCTERCIPVMGYWTWFIEFNKGIKLQAIVT